MAFWCYQRVFWFRRSCENYTSVLAAVRRLAESLTQEWVYVYRSGESWKLLETGFYCLYNPYEYFSRPSLKRGNVMDAP
jgi:hypothetical protein